MLTRKEKEDQRERAATSSDAYSRHLKQLRAIRAAWAEGLDESGETAEYKRAAQLAGTLGYNN
jgi:hypothetical protein